MPGGGRGMPPPAIVDPYQRLVRRDRPRGSRCPKTQAPEPGSNNWVMSGAHTDTGKPLVVERPAPRRHEPVAALHHAPERAGLERDRRAGAAVCRHRASATTSGSRGASRSPAPISTTCSSRKSTRQTPTRSATTARGSRFASSARQIPVKDAAPRAIELKFSRHGPIFFEDATNHRAYALRSVMNEPGTGAYLGGLRLSQARDCKEFLEAALYWKAPTENLICGDVDGNISFQGSALTPKRVGWSRPPAGAGHRQVRMARLPHRPAAAAQPAAGLHRDRQQQRQRRRHAAGDVQDAQQRHVRAD